MPSLIQSPGRSFPISVKGVILHDGEVLLGRNDRQEWELPGGRLEPDESPQQCVAREVAEETGWQVKVADDRPVDVWVYQPLPERDPQRRVVIVTYGCVATTAAELVRSPEHHEVALVALERLEGLRLPQGYRRSIATWAAIWPPSE